MTSPVTRLGLASLIHARFQSLKAVLLQYLALRPEVNVNARANARIELGSIIDTTYAYVVSRVHNGRGRVSNEGIMLDTSARMFTSVY